MFHYHTHVSIVMIDKLLSWMQGRPSTKVHSAPGGGSSLDYLFGGGGASGGGASGGGGGK